MSSTEICNYCSRKLPVRYVVRGNRMCFMCCPKSHKNDTNLIGRETKSEQFATPSNQRLRNIPSSSSRLREMLSENSPMKFNFKRDMCTNTEKIIHKDATTDTADNDSDCETVVASPENISDQSFDINLTNIEKNNELLLSNTISKKDGFIFILASNLYRKNVLFLPNLSPENLGPFRLPNGEVCLSLRNFWEFSKISEKYIEVEYKNMFESIGDYLMGVEDKKEKIKEVFYEIRELGLESTIFQEQLSCSYSFDEKVICYLFIDKDNKKHFLTPDEAVIIYYHYCEKIISQTDEYIKLMNLRKEKYNMEIMGSESTYHIYVLYNMLKESDSTKYPWNTEIAKNKKIKELLDI